MKEIDKQIMQRASLEAMHRYMDYKMKNYGKWSLSKTMSKDEWFTHTLYNYATDHMWGAYSAYRFQLPRLLEEKDIEEPTLEDIEEIYDECVLTVQFKKDSALKILSDEGIEDEPHQFLLDKTLNESLQIYQDQCLDHLMMCLQDHEEDLDEVA